MWKLHPYFNRKTAITVTTNDIFQKTKRNFYGTPKKRKWGKKYIIKRHLFSKILSSAEEVGLWTQASSFFYNLLYKSFPTHDLTPYFPKLVSSKSTYILQKNTEKKPLSCSILKWFNVSILQTTKKYLKT